MFFFVRKLLWLESYLQKLGRHF